jgi:hypothetical protein
MEEISDKRSILIEQMEEISDKKSILIEQIRKYLFST